VFVLLLNNETARLSAFFYQTGIREFEDQIIFNGVFCQIPPLCCYWWLSDMYYCGTDNPGDTSGQKMYRNTQAYGKSFYWGRKNLPWI